MSNLTEIELKELIDAYRSGTEDVLRGMGLDVKHPIESQKDQAFLRRSRESSEQVAAWVKRGVIMTAISSLATVVWLGIQQAFKG